MIHHSEQVGFPRELALEPKQRLVHPWLRCDAHSCHVDRVSVNTRIIAAHEWWAYALYTTRCARTTRISHTERAGVCGYGGARWQGGGVTYVHASHVVEVITRVKMSEFSSPVRSSQGSVSWENKTARESASLALAGVCGYRGARWQGAG